MEIRARLSLEVAKFKANAKVVAAQFKAMSTSAENYSKNVDKYIEKNLQNRLAAIEKIKRVEQRALQFSDAQQRQAAKKKSGSTALQFGTVGPQQTGRQYESRAAMQIQSQITQAERKATAERVIIANKAVQKKTDAEKKRYNEWLRVNTKQTARAKELAKQQSFQVKVDFFMNDEDFNRRLAATRYALYDIGNRAIAFGAAVAAAMGAAVKSAIEFESAFTSVERTAQVDLKSQFGSTRAEATALRDALIDISTTIPVAFGQVTEIATLGAQLGIATEDLDEFTQTVAKFSSITGISVEAAALSFGRLSELLNVDPAQFENLSSAIVFAGINAVATDAEILKMGESIAAASTQAGIAAADTLGFATALASLKVRPEEARGVLTRLFREFDLLVTEGGTRLDDFSKILGKTSEETAQIWKTDPSQFVQSFLRGAEATGALNETMTALGIVNTRELNVITRLANNMDVLESAIADTNEQFLLGTFSTDAYGKVADDLASKITILQNSIAAMGAALGEQVSGPLAAVVDILTSFTEGIRNSPDFVKFMIASLTSLVAGLSIFIGLLTLGTAGLLALKLAFQNLNGGTIPANISLSTFRALVLSMIPNAGAATTVLGGMSASLWAVAKGSTGASLGMRLLAGATAVAMGPVGIAVALVGALGFALVGMAAEAEKSKTAMFEAAGGIEAVLDAAAKDADSAAEPIRKIKLGVEGLTEAEKENLKNQKDAVAAREASKGKLVEQTEAVKEATKRLTDYETAVDGATGAVEENTLALGGNVAALILDSLGNYDGEGSDFWLRLTELDPAIEATLNAIGFDAAAMVTAGMEEGGETAEAYAKRYEGAVRLIADSTSSISPAALENYRNILAGMGFDMTTQELLAMNAALGKNGAFVSNQIGFLRQAGKATDGFIEATITSADAADRKSKSLENLAGSEEDATDQAVILNEALRNQIKLLTSNDISEGKVASALDSFAQSAKETAGEMDGLGEAARTNLSNFASFMDAAVDSSIAAGTGTNGALETIIGGLYALANAGVDTGDAFSTASGFIVQSLESIIPGITQMFGILGAPQSMQGVEDAIRALYAAKIAAADTPDDVRRLRVELENTLAMIAGFGSKFTVNMGNVSKSTEKTKTKLEQLNDAIAKLFSWTNKRMALQDSINSLGDSLEENGNTFSIWSKEGRQNVGALLDTIENMATMSNGDMQLFANQLGAMRQALVQVGAPASALKIIDNALNKTGKTAKVSTKEVANFYRELADSDEAERSLVKIAEAVSNVQSSLKASLSAYFAQGNAIDDITLGWLDMSDAADSASDAIENAKETVEDARQAIDEANASIQGLAAQKNTLEYQLQIALKYGDVLRADEIRAEIAAINADIASQEDSISDSNRDIARAQEEMAEARGALGIDSTTRQVIEQNRALQDMANRYADAAAWMLVTAGEGADLNAIIESQVEDFYNNAIQMGYSEEKARDLANILRTELIATMEAIPEDISTDINAETSAALAKVTKFAADANARLNTIRDKTVTVTTRQVVIPATRAPSGGTGGSVVAFSSGGYVRGPGNATSDSISARLSNGEFVVRAAAVSRYGVDFFNSLNQMQAPTRSYQGGATVSSSASQTVYLSPEDRQLLRQAIDRPVALYTDNATIAKSANDGNAILAQRGIR